MPPGSDFFSWDPVDGGDCCALGKDTGRVGLIG